ncbi:hypothetical protein [Streptomyces sp. NPDC012466]|uniref:hypothetical protein n=1 Tax=Streptomyces sp. NPDC012466 TaxID=3364835 RepID=UPI0036E99D43
MRGALALLPEMEDDIGVVAQVATGGAILEAAALAHHPDAAFLDVELPGGSGVEALREARRRGRL